MKKQYSKPMIKKVNLVMEEAVLIGCKVRSNDTGRGGRGNRCSTTPTCQTASPS